MNLFLLYLESSMNLNVKNVARLILAILSSIIFIDRVKYNFIFLNSRDMLSHGVRGSLPKI